MQIKINRETDNLMKDKEAFLMLLKIAYLTKREDSFSIPDLEIGEALITADILDITTATFRSTKEKLKRWGFAEFKPTARGTIAKMTTDKFFVL